MTSPVLRANFISSPSTWAEAPTGILSLALFFGPYSLFALAVAPISWRARRKASGKVVKRRPVDKAGWVGCIVFSFCYLWTVFSWPGSTTGIAAFFLPLHLVILYTLICLNRVLFTHHYRPLGWKVYPVRIAVALEIATVAATAYSIWDCVRARGAAAADPKFYHGFWCYHDRFALAYLARSTRCPAQVLVDLASRSEAALMREHNTLRDIYERPLKTHPVMVWVAENPATPGPTLVALAEGKDGFAKEVAANRATPSDLLWRLAHRNNADINWALARNPGCPPGIWMQLAHRGEEKVRRVMAMNRGMPDSVLRALSQDGNPEVRWQVAANPSTPIAVRESMRADPDSAVRTAATGPYPYSWAKSNPWFDPLEESR